MKKPKQTQNTSTQDCVGFPPFPQKSALLVVIT